MESDIIERLREQSNGMLPSGEYAFLRKKDIEELLAVIDRLTAERDEARQGTSELAMDELARLDEMLDPSAHLTFRRATTPRKEPHGND